PHSLTARALVVAPSDVLHVGNAAGREPVEVAVDGVHVADLAAGAALEVRFVDNVGLLAQLPGTSFYQRLREKFGHLAVSTRDGRTDAGRSLPWPATGCRVPRRPHAAQMVD